MNNLSKYLEDNLIKFEQVSDNIVKIEEKTYQLILPDKEKKIFDDSFELLCDDTEEDNYIFEFGGKWYWTPKGTERTPQLNPVKYIGKANVEQPFLPWLGIHGKYEILNGSRDYKDWCKKGSFMQTSCLGICELNTLAGAILFQMECKSAEIKSIIGETFVVRNQTKDLHYRIKLYAKNEAGWQTLLRFNKSVNVDNNSFVDEDFFWNNIADCVIVVDPKYVDFDYFKENHRDVFSEAYYQLDTVKYDNQDSDKKFLENFAKFIRSDIRPILIQDSYYLDKEDAYIKTKLNQISGNREFKAENQYFKSFDDVFNELDELFDKDSSTFDSLINSSMKNLMRMVKECDFAVDLDNFHLPDYVLTQEQSKNFKDKNELFLSLIEEGFKMRVPKGKKKEYRERLDREIGVISQGYNLEDYFLILWDIIHWCDSNNILVGIGRGSAGGCLISFLLGIVRLDPIKYDLLFERFLNENRIKKSLPDVDCDFEGLRRDDIKAYMENRFGLDNVCSVGTYANMKLKMAISDLAKLNNIDFATSKMITAILDDVENEGTKWDDIFRLCSTSERLRSFVKYNGDIINDIQLILMQPRSASVHACATIVTPSNKTIFEWFPVKKMKNKNDQDVLVSEWEGFYLDKAGFLKEDILGIQQLDKFKFIMNLVKSNRGDTVDIYNLNLEDKKVFKYFSNGWNEDVFQFGTRGLKQYSKEVRPDSVEELTAMNALFRPGAMKSNAHSDYVDIKFGKKEPEYDYMLKSVTSKTYGLYIYQEQTMLAAQKLGGFTLAEADMMRKVMLNSAGKKQERDKFYLYMNAFVDGAVKNGCDKGEATRIWNKLEAFAAYGFNRSHSIAYAVTGYICQYLKVHYPIEFWTCAFTFVPTGKQQEKIPAYISEIHQTGDINMFPPDINKSGDGFTPNFENNSIYWSLNSVKQCGEKAVEQLVESKQKDGEYFSFDEFLERNVAKGSKVTKQVVEHLVMCGAFDEVEKIKQARDRNEFILSYRKRFKVKIDKEKDLLSVNKDMLQYNWWWNLQQKRLCGFALFDFTTICENYLDSTSKYMDAISIQDRESDKVSIVTGGYINEITIRTSKKGEYAEITLDNNFEFITLKLWQDSWDAAKDILIGKEKSLLLLSGKISYDKYKKKNVVTLFEDSDILILE